MFKWIQISYGLIGSANVKALASPLNNSTYLVPYL